MQNKEVKKVQELLALPVSCREFEEELTSGILCGHSPSPLRLELRETPGGVLDRPSKLPLRSRPVATLFTLYLHCFPPSLVTLQEPQPLPDKEQERGAFRLPNLLQRLPGRRV